MTSVEALLDAIQCELNVGKAAGNACMAAGDVSGARTAYAGALSWFRACQAVVDAAGPPSTGVDALADVPSSPSTDCPRTSVAAALAALHVQAPSALKAVLGVGAVQAVARAAPQLAAVVCALQSNLAQACLQAAEGTLRRELQWALPPHGAAVAASAANCGAVALLDEAVATGDTCAEAASDALAAIVGHLPADAGSSSVAACFGLATLGAKASGRAARALAMLAAIEGVFLLEHLHRSASGAGATTAACGEGARRRYKLLLRAWHTARNAATRLRGQLDALRDHLAATAADPALDVASHQQAAALCLADLEAAAAAYAAMACGDGRSGPRFQNAAVMPYSSAVHGVGLVTVGPVEDGDVLLREAPVVCIRSGLDYAERFAAAVAALKDIEAAGRQECAGLNPSAVAGGLLPASALLERVLLGRARGGIGACASLLVDVLALHQAGEADSAAASTDPSAGQDAAAAAVPAHGLSEGDALLCSIWHNNAMRVENVDFRVGGDEGGDGGGEGEPRSALYVLSSRLNHSHKHPNALCVFDPASGHLTVRALVAIPPGRELFISYCPILASALEQAKHLRFPVREFRKRGPQHSGDEGASTANSPAPVPAPDDGLDLPEQETGDDVLAPHLTGLEQLVCPSCGVAVEGRRVSAAVRSFQCKVCRTPIPIADYYRQIDATRARAAAFAEAPEGRAKAAKLLLGVEDGARMLHVHHFLRFQVRLEALAAAVGASLTAELSIRTVDLSQSVADRAAAVCPKAWPLVTGLRMHHVYCVGRHRVGTESTGLSNFSALLRAAPPAGGRSSQTHEQSEAGPSFAAEPADTTNRRVLRFLFLSMQEHVSQRGADGAMATFLERYRPELESIGIRDPPALEGTLRIAALVLSAP